MLFAGLGLVRILKNCDLGPENIAVGHSFFTIRTSQSANSIDMYLFQNCFPVWNFVWREDFLQKQFLSVEISFIFIVPGALLPAVPGLALLYHIQKCNKVVLSCLVLSRSNGFWGCVENHFIRAIEHTASSRHSRGWENSPKLCKFSATSLVCITVSNSSNPPRV